MDQRAIHLEQTTEHVTRIGWNVQNHLLEDQQRFLAIDHQVADPTLMILHNEDVLGRVFTYNNEVELMHIALNGLKICHPLPLQAAVTITPPLKLRCASRCSQAPLARRRRRRAASLRAALPPVHQVPNMYPQRL